MEKERGGEEEFQTDNVFHSQQKKNTHL